MSAPPDVYGRRIAAGTELHRIHSTLAGSAAFFDADRVRGRFNLVGVTDRGTCYLALDPLGAYVETLGRILTRSISDIARRRHTVVTLERDLQLFDLTRSEARSAYRSDGLDLTATIGAGDSYDTPQRLARLTHDDGYDGIVYTARHDPGHRYESVALFGPAGPHESDVVFASAKTSEIAADLILTGTRTFGIVILPDPPT